MTTTISAAGQAQEAMANLGRDLTFNSDKIVRAVVADDLELVDGLRILYTYKMEHILDLLLGITTDLEAARLMIIAEENGEVAS